MVQFKHQQNSQSSPRICLSRVLCIHICFCLGLACRSLQKCATHVKLMKMLYETEARVWKCILRGFYFFPAGFCSEFYLLTVGGVFVVVAVVVYERTTLQHRISVSMPLVDSYSSLHSVVEICNQWISCQCKSENGPLFTLFVVYAAAQMTDSIL